MYSKPSVPVLLFVILLVAECLAQTPQPVITPLPIPSTTPLPFFNPYRPNFAPQFIAPNPYNIAPAFVPILQQTFDITPEGSYSFSYQSADGTQRQETGSLKYPTVAGFEPAMSVQGSYSSLTSEGAAVEVTYIADENGYQPSGPGIHPSILRAVAQQVEQARQEKSQPRPIQ
ncbi:endocuticle structural glycoprotein SgAbd-9-like [Adelges cooleyi]|uniref:endocuticle structural glycoprotein SgAbd-9-like n=1 Tax=Adelges cooleyi TaxID=133065 RepID=UPI00217FAF18|nr:endocuticle structural glycoprotein SgAbd-9-like [Adelges cooleyi]